jgi:hypothetical protein
VSWGRRSPGGSGSPVEAVRAATLGGLAQTAGLILGGGVAVELNRRSVTPDPELPLERGDAVAFERA